MIIKNTKEKSSFNNKYWMVGHMLSELSEYSKTKDIELYIERCKMPMSLFIYCDDLSTEELLKIFNNSKHFNKREFIPEIDQKYYDDADFTFNCNSSLFRLLGEYKNPSLVKIINWEA